MDVAGYERRSIMGLLDILGNAIARELLVSFKKKKGYRGGARYGPMKKFINPEITHHRGNKGGRRK